MSGFFEAILMQTGTKERSNSSTKDNSMKTVKTQVGLLLPHTGAMPLQAKGNGDRVELYFDEIGRKTE